MRMSEKVMLGIVIISFIIAWYVWPLMPDAMPSHWNAAGEVDGYLPKLWGLMLFPFISLALLLLFAAIPRIDPLKNNLEKSRGRFDTFVVIIMAFLLYIYLLTLAWALGLELNIIQMMAPALGIVFFYAGVLMRGLKKNWFVGIRTPWTMSSDKVWRKTHDRGAKLFMASGIIAVFGAVLQDYAIWLIIAPVMASSVYAIAYSYLEFRKEQG